MKFLLTIHAMYCCLFPRSVGCLQVPFLWSLAGVGTLFDLAVLPTVFLVIGTEPGGSWPVEEHAENELSEFEMEVLFYLRTLSGEYI